VEPFTFNVLVGVALVPMFTLLVVYALEPSTSVKMPPPEPAELEIELIFSSKYFPTYRYADAVSGILVEL